MEVYRWIREGSPSVKAWEGLLLLLLGLVVFSWRIVNCWPLSTASEDNEVVNGFRWCHPVYYRCNCT